MSVDTTKLRQLADAVQLDDPGPDTDEIARTLRFFANELESERAAHAETRARLEEELVADKLAAERAKVAHAIKFTALVASDALGKWSAMAKEALAVLRPEPGADAEADAVIFRTSDPTELEFLGGPYENMRPQVGEFHCRDGLTFLRTHDCSVIVRQWTKRDGGWYFRSLTLRPLTREEWRSVGRVLDATQSTSECDCKKCVRNRTGAP